MDNEEKRILFDALNEIMSNQKEIMKHLNIKDDFYYTDRAIKDTGRVCANIDNERDMTETAIVKVDVRELDIKEKKDLIIRCKYEPIYFIENILGIKLNDLQKQVIKMSFTTLNMKI